MNMSSLSASALTLTLLAVPSAAQRVDDGVITYPGGYTIEQGTPFELPPPVADAGYATESLILNGPEPPVSAPFIGGGPTQRLLDLAGGAGGYVAAWNDTRDGNAALFVGFLDPTGEHPRDGAPVHHPRSSRQLYPNLELLDGDDTQPVRGGIVWGANEMGGLKAKVRYFEGPRDWPDENAERASEAFLIDAPQAVADLAKGARPNLALAGDLGIVAWTVNGQLGAYSMQVDPNRRRYAYRDKVLIAPQANPKGGAFELALNKSGDVLAAWSEARDRAPFVRLASVNLNAPARADALDFGPGLALDLAASETGQFWLLVQADDELQLVLLEKDGSVSRDQDVITVAEGDVAAARLTLWGGGVGAAVVAEMNLPGNARGDLRAVRAGEAKLHVFAANGKRVTPKRGIDALDDDAVDARDVHVAARGNDFLVAWTDSRNDRSDIFYRLLSLDDFDAPARRWNRDESAADQVHASVATSGRTALVAWEDARRGDTEVFVRAVHLNADKQLELGREGPLNDEPTGSQFYPRIAMAADGTGFVTWKENLEGRWILRGQAVDAEGAPVGKARDLDRGNLAVHQFPAAIQALPGTGGYVVAWIRVGTGPVAQRFDARGKPRGDAKPVMARPVNDAMRPTIALGEDDRLLVAWDQEGTKQPAPGSQSWSQRVVVARFVDPNGSPDGSPIYFPPSPEGGDIDAALTARPGGFVLAWTGNDSPTRDVYARLLDDEGQPTGAPMGISVRYHEQDFAEATTLHDGRVIVAWEDDISGRDHCFLRTIQATGGRGSARAELGTRYLMNDVETVFVEDRHAPVLAPLGDGAILVWDDLARGKGHDIAARYVELD